MTKWSSNQQVSMKKYSRLQMNGSEKRIDIERIHISELDVLIDKCAHYVSINSISRTVITFILLH